MTLTDIILLAIGLAMDCFSVAFVQGIRTQGMHFTMPAVIVWMIVAFGVFQGAMPLIGYFAGEVAESLISRYAGWVALFLLGGIGIKMIYDGLSEQQATKPLTAWQVVLLAIATAIDAAVSGILFVPIPQILLNAMLIIAITSSLFTLIGYIVGHFIGRLPINAEIVGGGILILIGVKICFF